VKVRWVSWNQDATETLILTEKPEGIFIKSTINNHEKHFTIKYTLNCEAIMEG
jgi:hypothetical protein